MVFAGDWLLPILLSLAALLLALRGLAGGGAWFPEDAGMLSVLGYPVYFVCVYLLSFPEVLAVLLLTMLAVHVDERGTGAVALAWAALILCNIALLVHGGVFIVEGSAEARPGLTALGCVLIAVVVVTRYLDLFESLLMRSLAFFIVGAIVFWAGNFYQRQQAARAAA